MPSKHKTLAAEEYKIISVKPSYDGENVLKTMVNSKGEKFVRIASRGDLDVEESLPIQYKAADSSGDSTDQRKSKELTSIKHAADEQNAFHAKTKAHHILYTKTPGGTVYRKAEESSVNEYTANRVSSRKSEIDGEKYSKSYVRKDTTRVGKTLDEVDTCGFDWKPHELQILQNIQRHRNKDTEDINNNSRYSRKMVESEMRSFEENTEAKKTVDKENDFHKQSLVDANDRLVNGIKTESKRNGTNFMVEADRLIKEYKKKYGSRDNLDESDKDDDFGRKVNETRIKEMLSEKTVVITKEDKTEQNRDKRSSGKSAKINRKDACFHCGDSVYQKEKIGPIRDVLFHAYCFRCSTCGTVLNLYNYYQSHKDMHDRAVYCKSHQPSPDSSKVDIAHKSIQAVINKPKLERVSSNVRAGPDSKTTIGADAVSIKNAMNVPKLGRYNPTVRLTTDSGITDHIDTKAVFVQTAMKAPKLDVYNATVRPVPAIAHNAQHGQSNSHQRNSGIMIHTTSQSPPVHHGSNPLHSLYLHQP